MFPFNTITLLTNGLTLSLALGFLLIVLWYDVRRPANQAFAAFLMMVTLWNAGSLLSGVMALIEPDSLLITLAAGLKQTGFIGSCVAIYVLATVLIGAHSRLFRVMAFSSLFLVVIYNAFLIVITTNTLSISIAIDPQSAQEPITVLFYLIFDTATIYLVWQHRRKIRSRGLVAGIFVFVAGQGLGFLNPDLGIADLSITISAVAALTISFSILRMEIIDPLSESMSQVDTVHRVSLAITSQIATDMVLNEITRQSIDWVDADAACIFLTDGDELAVVKVEHLPIQFLRLRLQPGEGVAGQAVQTRKSVYLENYSRDWRGAPDFPLAKETFGSIICVPLIYGEGVIGALMVIAGRQGHLLRREDVHLLELLSAQAAVAISYGRLFGELRNMTGRLRSAHAQLETLLVSTENPVIAVDRRMRVIFFNPAASKVFLIEEEVQDKPIQMLLPPNALPPNFRTVLRDLRHKRTHVYEIVIDNKTYQCHVASLGEKRIEGWVAVLNDVTQLKELDRLKSEMVRMTSHDLKNPLQAAMANIELLSEDLGEHPDPEIRRSLNTIEKQLDKMNRIIRGVLDLERVQVGVVSLEVCQARLISERILDELSDFAMEHDIRLIPEIAEGPIEFIGNGGQIERALANLVENAIKFTPAGGCVWLAVRQEDDRVIFRVRDNGIGIPVDMQDKIFDRFFRGRQKSVEYVSGSGLGLSLVKAVVENHGGEISVSSGEGAGATFTIVLPAKETGGEQK